MRIPASLAIGGLVACTAVAGPLNPPAGPVASSYKSLAEVEPRIAINATNTPGSTTYVYGIDQPGSYYLTENLTGVSGKAGIRVGVSNVTIDLNGFSLRGVTGSAEAITGHPAGNVNVVVLNGTIEFQWQDGIDLATSAGNIRIEGVSVRNNAGTGIRVGLNSIVERCMVFSSDGQGISAGDGSTISRCTVRACDGSGIDAAANCTITECASTENGGIGIDTNDACVVTACTALSNQSHGIYGLGALIATGCSSRFNGGHGFLFGIGSTLADCSANDNTIDGFAGSTSILTRCNAASNDGNGIYLSVNGTVDSCVATGNGADGIRVFSDCLVSRNTSVDNGLIILGAGIHAIGGENRIDGNHCGGSDRGIDVDNGGNVIIRNTCSGNTTNWTIVASNYYGPIIDRTGVVTAAVNGNSAVGTLASTDPHANFSY